MNLSCSGVGSVSGTRWGTRRRPCTSDHGSLLAIELGYALDGVVLGHG